MLAKAVATEAGANFLNVSMSSVASKWFGEGERYMRAVFSLASKIAPAVIFIDEVDSMLGSRNKASEHEAMRKIKNEFMSNWDGLRTKEHERVRQGAQWNPTGTHIEFLWTQTGRWMMDDASLTVCVLVA
jgi:SpoVK/Ycf46/Vps4 family AAA+-type ATPase